MASLGETFYPDEIEPRDDFSPVPEGTYSVEIIESSVADLKSGNGRTIKLTLAIGEGEYEGRRIWANINFRHTSEKAQRIGQQQLAELCAAIGFHGALEDTEVLHGIPLKARVKISHQEGYEPRNEVTKFLPYDAAAAPAKARSSAKETARQDRAESSQAQATNGKRPSFMDRVKTRQTAA